MHCRARLTASIFTLALYYYRYPWSSSADYEHIGAFSLCHAITLALLNNFVPFHVDFFILRHCDLKYQLLDKWTHAKFRDADSRI